MPEPEPVRLPEPSDSSTRPRRRGIVVLSAWLLGALLLAWTAPAGLARPPTPTPSDERCKRWRDELHAPGLTVHYEGGLHGLAERCVREYPSLKKAAERKLGFAYPAELTVHVVRDHAAFNALIVARGGRKKPEHVAAVAFGFDGLIVLKSEALTRQAGDAFPTTFQHEIVHCMLGYLERENVGCSIPLWLNEGLAQWVSEAVFLGEPDALEAAVRGDELLSFDELGRAFPEQEGASALAYAQSLSLVRFLDGYGRDDGSGGNLPDLLELLRRGAPIRRALYAVTGRHVPELEAEWRGDVRRRISLPLRHLPAIFFTVTSVTLVLLGYATYRVRRERRLREMDETEREQKEAPAIAEPGDRGCV